MTLSARHQTLLEGSGIPASYVAERPYDTATKASQLERLGFSPKQRSVPALIVPVYNVHGEVALYQVRPDQPRVVDGKALKYETPKGASMIVDVPPRVRPTLGDPEIPLFITEGVRKADAAALRGISCVALLGVWNWRGSNDKGGKMSLPCWESIALAGRRVYVVFDSDVMEKQAVHLALCRLKAFLEQRKAHVRLVYLPPGPGGKKTGLDDWLQEDPSRGVIELVERAQAEVRELPLDVRAEGRTIEHDLDNWIEMDGCTVEAKAGEEGGERFVSRFDGIARLTKIDRRWQEDDDQGWRFEEKWTYALQLASGESMTKILEPGAAPFLKMLEEDREGASSCHGPSERSKLYQWVRRASRETVESVEVRRALGPQGEFGWLCPPSWSVREGQLEQTEFVVEPPPGQTQDLKRYRFTKLDDARFREVGRWIVDVLLRCDHHDQALTIPMLGAVLAAPIWAYVPTLGTWQRYGFFTQGPSGIGKTQLMRYFMSFWGDFLQADGLSTWRDTVTTIEDILHRIVGAPVFVADWKRANFVREQEKSARALIQAYADRSARGRSSQKAETQKKKHPRCTLIMDGEDLPEGQEATLGRLVIVEARATEPTKRCATAEERGLDPAMVRDLPGVTARWIGWVQKNAERLRKAVSATEEQLEELLPHGSTNRTRLVRNYTTQILTVRAVAKFLEEEAGIEGLGAMDQRSTDVHLEHAAKQLGRVVSQSAGEQFLAGLRAVLMSGDGMLHVRAGEPTGIQPFPRAHVAARALGTYSAITWEADIWPDVAIPLVQQHVSKGGGERIEFSRAAILQQLQQEGLVIGGETRPRPKGQAASEWRRPRVWTFPLDVLGADDRGESGTGPESGPA